jgi:protein-tyrosine-phosphatase
MKRIHAKDQVPKVLFVCYGNTCRSPMAEGLARKILGEKARVDSAGLMPVFESAAPDAVAILKELFDVDISQHRPRDVSELSLDEYDRIIVLDTYVYNTMSKLMKNLAEKFVLWDTEDPFGQDRETYERVAKWLNAHLIENLLPLLFGR